MGCSQKGLLRNVGFGDHREAMGLPSTGWMGANLCSLNIGGSLLPPSEAQPRPTYKRNSIGGPGERSGV